MVHIFAVFLALIVGLGWGFWRRRQDPEEPRFPKLESAWLGCFTGAIFAYFGDRLADGYVLQVLNWGDLWINTFPFLILVTILLAFSLHVTKSPSFRGEGLQTQKRWRLYLLSPIGAILVTLPAIEVLNRATDLSASQEVEVVALEKFAGPAAFIKTGGFCAVQVRNPFQDLEFWNLRVAGDMCDGIRAGISPLRLHLNDGRLGIPYLTAIDASQL